MPFISDWEMQEPLLFLLLLMLLVLSLLNVTFPCPRSMQRRHSLGLEVITTETERILVMA